MLQQYLIANAIGILTDAGISLGVEGPARCQFFEDCSRVYAQFGWDEVRERTVNN